MQYNFLERKLQKRKNEGLLRSLSEQTGIDFSSNDYLGLARSSQDRLPSQNQPTVNTPSGATGSRLLSGNHPAHVALEEYLAKYYGSESSLLCSSGYVANLSLLSCIAEKGDTILYDEKSHASIKEALRLSQAKFYKFKHNDESDLSQKIHRATGQVFVVIESVYSMDGTEARLKEITEVCTQNNAYLIVDEAHSTGIYGKKGEGYTLEKGFADQVFARIHTFGKGVGSHGACICGPKKLKDFLINFSRPVIYTTAPPPSHAEFLLERHEYISQQGSTLREQLRKNIQYFRKSLEKQGVQHRFLASNSPIQGLLVPGNDECRKLADQIRTQGYRVFPILSPTVPEGQERIRMCLHSFNTQEELDGLVGCLLPHI